MRIGIERPDETRPIPLHNGYYGCICGEIAGGGSTIRVINTPNCMQLDRVGDAEPGGLLIRVDDIVAFRYIFQT